MLKRIASLLLISVVAACGGSGDAGCSVFSGSSASCNPGGGTTPAATNLVLQLDKSSVTNSGSDSVGVTVTATDANNNVVSSAPVTLSADTNAVVVATSSKTDTSGKITASVLVGSENRSNRTVTVTASSSGITKSATFAVTGAKLVSTVIGAPFTPGSAGQINYVLTDVNANPMSNQPITVSGVGADSTGTTDATGAYVFKFAAPTVAQDYKAHADAGGTTRDDTFTVAAAGTISPVPAGTILSASVSANPSVVPVNTTTTNNQSAIRALFLGSNNAPIKNVRVRFDLASDVNSIGGTFTTGSQIVYSDANGLATTAYIAGNRFSPTDGVTVRACYGYTDADVSGTNCANFATTTLTVVSEAISVSIGTNNLLVDHDDPLTYMQDFVVTVVDSSGRAKPGVVVTPSIDILRFGKGQWSSGTGGWTLSSASAPQYFYNSSRTTWYLEDPRTAAEKAADPTGSPLISTAAACWNEDRNRNGVLEAAEDSKTGGYSISAGGNGNGKLDPAKSDIAISMPNGATTDSAGKVNVRIEYAKNLGSWLEYKILVAASGIGGTEGRATWTDVLKVAAKDISDNTVEPPFSKSRYGILAGCNNPN